MEKILSVIGIFLIVSLTAIAYYLQRIDVSLSSIAKVNVNANVQLMKEASNSSQIARWALEQGEQDRSDFDAILRQHGIHIGYVKGRRGK